MAILSGGRDRIETNNKVDGLETGTYEVTIVDEWVHYVVKERDGEWADGAPRYRSKFSREKTDDQEIKISIRLDADPDIVLEKRMPAYVSKNAAFAKIVSSLTGLVPGSPEMKAWDTKNLVGMKANADLVSNAEGYVRVANISARPKTVVRAKPITNGNGAAATGAATPTLAARAPSSVKSGGANGVGPQLSSSFGKSSTMRPAGHNQGPPDDGPPDDITRVIDTTEGREVHPSQAKWLEYINGQTTDERKRIAIRNLGLPDKPQPKNGGNWIINAYGRIVSDAPIPEAADEVYDDMPPDPEIPF